MVYAEHMPLFLRGISQTSPAAVAGVTDMRKGFDGLAALVQTALAGDPFSGQKRSVATSPAAKSTMPTTPLYRRSNPGEARPGLDACGPMYAMIVQPAASSRRRCGSVTRRIARAPRPQGHLKPFAGTLQADGYGRASVMPQPMQA